MLAGPLLVFHIDRAKPSDAVVRLRSLTETVSDGSAADADGLASVRAIVASSLNRYTTLHSTDGRYWSVVGCMLAKS